MHQQAVEALPTGGGELWLDVGCGPGLVSRLAARHGYRSKGIDPNPAMIAAARKLARRQYSTAEFQTS